MDIKTWANTLWLTCANLTWEFFSVYSENMMITYTAHVHTEYIYTIHLLMITKWMGIHGTWWWWERESTRKLTSDYQMRIWFRRSSTQKQRVAIRPAQQNTFQCSSDNQFGTTYKSVFRLAQSLGGGECELLQCLQCCAVSVSLCYVRCATMNFYPHQIQFDWLGKWHWQSKKATRALPSARKQFTTSE